MHFTPQELWAATGTPVRVVLIVLMAMAIWCFYIAIERAIALAKARKQSRLLAEEVAAPLQAANAAEALAVCQKDIYAEAYLGHMLTSGLTEFAARQDKYGIEAAERALEMVSVTESQSLRKGMDMLATTGATAPFVGLVGTIFGIINAFQMMGEAGGGDLAAISSGIAEALITTAIGITVAIIGVWLFNYFNGKIDEITNDMSVSVQELLDWCEKQVIPAPGKTE